ncbi:MAG: hypothetical protein IPM54_28470 [Polyangiaceae bacterium]|nr:hypothetical protein [Polyangiaceae bacterium]
MASLVLSAFSALGCEASSDSSLLTGAGAVTSIFVDASFFMGDVPCAAVPGAMQSYVAHIYDVTSQQPVALPAAPPVSCSAGVTFRQVVVGRKYRIKIDGYDVAPSDLVPLGGASSGSRTMLRRSNPDAGPVTPLWTTHCKDVDTVQDTRVGATECEPLTPAPTATGITVDPRVALKPATPSLACKEYLIDPMGNPVETGDVHAFDVRPDDPSLPALLNLPCIEGGAAPPAFLQGVTAGQTYGFRVEARASAGGPVKWGTSCFAEAKEGLVVNATCDPLTSDGAMEIVLAGLLGPDTCSDANVVTYDASYAGPPPKSVKPVLGVDCAKSVRFTLEPGMHTVAVVGYRKGGDVALEAACTAVVEPGTVTVATCTLL